MIATILDTETDALIDNHSIKIERQPHVIEYFTRRVDLATGVHLGEYETLIKPPRPISREITGITGIDDDMVKYSPVFAAVANLIAGDIEKSQVVIAHNMSFDQEVIDIEFERLGRKIVWPRRICTVEATLHLKGFRLSLGALHEYLFGEDFKGHHRARADVGGLERICVELFKREEL